MTGYLKMIEWLFWWKDIRFCPQERVGLSNYTWDIYAKMTDLYTSRGSEKISRVYRRMLEL